MNSTKQKYNLQLIMHFYRGTISLFNHYSTTRYWIWALFFLLSLFSAKEMLNTDSNIGIKILFAIGAFLFLIMTYIGNEIYIKAVSNKAKIIFDIEDIIISGYFKSMISKHKKGEKKIRAQLDDIYDIKEGNERTLNLFKWFNKIVRGVLVIYTILLCYMVWITFGLRQICETVTQCQINFFF